LDIEQMELCSNPAHFTNKNAFKQQENGRKPRNFLLHKKLLQKTVLQVVAANWGAF
jgi:hypothetical protein